MPTADDQDLLAVGSLRFVEAGALEIGGLSLAAMPDGGFRVRMERLTVRQLAGRMPSASLVVGSAVLTGVVADVRPSPHAPTELLALSVREITADDVQLVIHEIPDVSRTGAARLRLDALDDLDGIVRAFITDALWFVDAEIVVPIVDGRIDFRGVDVEHIGPNSTLSIGPTGVHVDAPHGARVDLLVFDHLQDSTGLPRTAGTSPAFVDQGVLELRAFIESMANAAPNQPIARVADPNLAAPLQRARLTGELRLGDGALGSDTHHVVLTGRGEDRNRVDVSSPALAQQVILRMPTLAASSGTFGLGDKSVGTSAVSAAAEVRLVARTGERPPTGGKRRALEIVLSHVTLRDVALTAVDVPAPPAGP
jgi:hypothetical protein